MLLLLALFSPAHAQHDYSEEAEKRMSLSFDLDVVEAELTGEGPAEPDAPVPTLPLEPNSALHAVTVFRDRAVVTRTQQSKGSATITFEGLPHTLRAEGLAGLVIEGDARILGVELVSTQAKVEQGDRYEAQRLEALELTKQLGEVRDRIEALLGQRAYLRFTLLAQRGAGAPQPDLGEVRNTLTYVGEAEAKLARSLREEEERATELSKDLAPLLVKMESPTATGRIAKVEVSGSGPATIGLRYHVDGASWTPAYNARLLPNDQVEIEYFGVVDQRTGESWGEAKLALSTANAAAGASLPQLQPWYLGRDRGLELDAGSVVSPVSDDDVPQGASLVNSSLTAELEGSGAVVFAIPGTRTIEGDGSSQRISMGTQTFAAHLDFATVPKLVQEVHRRASIRYDGEVPLLPGVVRTFVGADYLGSGGVAAVVPGEALRLSFGQDERLKVTRQLVTRRREFLNGKRTTRYHFRFKIEVSNYSGATRTVELRDQIPISELEKVTVKDIELTEGSIEDSAAGPGIRSWKLVVPDQGSKTVELAFTVTAPTETARQALQEMDYML